jgi:hypothetical protein
LLLQRSLEVEGVAASAKAFSERLAATKPGEPIRLRISRGGAHQHAEPALGANMRRRYTIRPLPAVTPQQTAMLDSWLPGN